MLRSAETSLIRTPALADVDVVFTALHGGTGEDGTVRAMLDTAGMAYTGSGHLASAIAMDKDMSSACSSPLASPRRAGTWSPARPKRWRGTSATPGGQAQPAGSTVGLSIVRSPDALDAAIQHAARFDREVMLEQFIAGRRRPLAYSATGPRRSARS